MITTLIADSIFDGKNTYHHQPISFENGNIIAFDTVSGAKEYKLKGLLCAGFIDVQVNGGGGQLLNQNINLNTLEQMVTAHAEYGTTSCLPTLITSDLESLKQTADIISQAIKSNKAGIIGVHFEGPHISHIKKGIHNTDHIRALTQEELDILYRDDLGIKMVTLAPEVVSPQAIKNLVEHNVHVSLGHSNANFSQTLAALDAGATGFTHLFNAMSALESREPNMVGAALVDKQSWCGLILDGHHVHPTCAKIAYQAKASEKMFLVSDAMSTIGSEQSAFHFDGHDIELFGNRLVSKTGQLAGSALTMISAVNNAIKMLDCTLEEAIKMASLYPANFLGISKTRGQLTIGGKADLTLISSNKNTPFQVLNTWISGNKLF